MRKIFLLLSVLYAPWLPAWGQTFVPFPETYNRLVQGIDFAPSGDTMYFALPHAERVKHLEGNPTGPRLALYMSLWLDDHWSEPELLPFSGKFDDYEPNLSPDGSILFFNSKRPFMKDVSKSNNLWYAHKVNGVWTEEAIPLPVLNQKEKEESYASLDNENILYYMSEFEVDSSIGYGVYTSHFEGGSTRPGVKLFGDEDRFFGDPCINVCGDTLVMTGWTPGAWETTCDLFISYKSNGNWSTPVPLPDMNSPGPDFSPSFSRDGKHFYYRRDYGFVKTTWQIED